MSGKTTTRPLPTLEEAEEAVRLALDTLVRVRASHGLPGLTGSTHTSAAYGKVRNRSAYCIGAAIGTGGKHSSCDGRYHGQRCTCDCHGAASLRPGVAQ